MGALGSLQLCWCSHSCVCLLVCADARFCLVVVPGSCRCALQEASQLQGDVQQLGQQVQDLAQQLLEAQNAKVSCPPACPFASLPADLAQPRLLLATKTPCCAQQHDRA